MSITLDSTNRENNNLNILGAMNIEIVWQCETPSYLATKIPFKFYSLCVKTVKGILVLFF